MTKISINSFRWWDPFGYPLSLLRATLARTIDNLSLRPDSCALDYGCGTGPYRLLLPEGCRYLGADLAGNPQADLVFGEEGKIPMPDGQVDLVLSTQVLEHVNDPAVYLRECLRVLKPGGRLLLTTHGLMIFHPHPQDFWRWTSEGLRLTVERAGLRVVSVEGLMGLVPAAIWLAMVQLKENLPWGLGHAFVAMCSLLIFVSDRFTKDESRAKNAWVYAVVAERPVG